jgi:osmotically-inducible protein OsmY
MQAQGEQVPHYLVQRVREALAHDPEVSELEIKVKVYGRKVYLSGTVATPERRDAITRIAGEVLPEHEVHNETTVGPLGAPGEAERLS